MVGSHLGQPGHELGVVAEHQLRLHPFLPCREAELLQPGRLGHGERLVGEVGQRRAPPQGQGLGQAGRGHLGPSVGGGPPALVHQPLEPGGVEVVGTDVQHVAGLPALEQWVAAGGQHLPQPGDLDLDRPGGVGRRLAMPQVVDDAVGRHQPAGVDEQQRQQGPLLRPPEVERTSLVLDLDGPEDAELHRPESTAGKRLAAVE